MTEQDLLALERRKANALIAETALGCQVRWNEKKHNGRGLGWFEPWLKFSDGRWCKCPDYLWSMAQCWWLVPELAKRDLYVEISPQVDRTYKVFVYDGAGNEEGKASHKWPQYAICIALLRALDVIEQTESA